LPHLVHVDHRWSGEGMFVPVVARLAETLALPLTVLAAPDPVDAREAPARQLRHAALARHAKSLSGTGGVATVALGHSASDRAETLAMRLMRGSGPFGLAVMPASGPSPSWPEGMGVTIIRPLASLSRAAIVARLGDHPELVSCSDPANTDPRHERVRWRQALSAPGPLLELASRAARYRELMAGLAARLVIDECPAGVLSLPHAALAGLPHESRSLLLDLMIAAASGRVHGPRGDTLKRLDAMLDKGARASMTLGGSRVVLSRGQVRIGRDRGGLFGTRDGVRAPVLDKLVDGAVVDGRFAVSLSGPSRAALQARGVVPEDIERASETRTEASALGGFWQSLDPLARGGLVGVFSDEDLIACGNWTSNNAISLQSQVKKRLSMRLGRQIWAS
jgi:hypothetical protein